MNRKERLINFKEEVLPKLQEIYEIKDFNTFVKIKIKDFSYDYYPMAQKICKQLKRPIWRELSIEEFKIKFLK